MKNQVKQFLLFVFLLIEFNFTRSLKLYKCKYKQALGYFVCFLDNYFYRKASFCAAFSYVVTPHCFIDPPLSVKTTGC